MPFISRRAPLQLTGEDSGYLDRLAQSRTESAARVQRARILQRYAEGLTVSAIAAALHTNRPKSGALRFEGFGTGCWGSFARSAGTRPTAFDYRRRQDLGGRLGMSETQRFGLCAGVVDDASASEAHSKTLLGGRAPAVAEVGARDGFQDLVGASGEAAQDSVLFGAARSGV